MKKPLLTVLTLLTSSLCIWADPVDRAKAKEIATAYMRGNQPPELIETSIAKRKGTDGHAPLYIFNRGNDQGFVIISGDDCMPYVLGYTEKGGLRPANSPACHARLVGRIQPNDRSSTSPGFRAESTNTSQRQGKHRPIGQCTLVARGSLQ